MGAGIRRAVSRDLHAIAEMCHLLWPDAAAEEHAREIGPLLGGATVSLLPAVVFVAEESESELVGFAQVGLRSHADGCDVSHAVGFLEGWYVRPEFRRRGIGARLVQAGEDWAREQGCLEMASDTWLDATDSQQAHEALGYREAGRCVNYKKRL